MLDPRAIAVQGLTTGVGALLVAVQGLWGIAVDAGPSAAYSAGGGGRRIVASAGFTDDELIEFAVLLIFSGALNG